MCGEQARKYMCASYTEKEIQEALLTDIEKLVVAQDIDGFWRVRDRVYVTTYEFNQHLSMGMKL